MRRNEELWANLFLLVVIASIMIILTSCASGPGVAAIDPGIPKYDMFGTVNGFRFDGVGIIPRSSRYDMRIESSEDIDLLTVTSCHREFSAESVIEQGWFNKKRGYDYIYTPAKGIEDSGSCLVRVGSYNSSKQGLNAHAVIDFEDPRTLLPAENICNGNDTLTGGVSICQSKIGLIERLRFTVPVHTVDLGTSLADGCKGTWLDPFTFEYRVAPGECIIAFDELSPPHRKHRHTTVGYTYVKIRGP